MRRKPKFYQTKSFKCLESEWRDKLVRSESLKPPEDRYVDIESGHKGTILQDLSERIAFKSQVKEANESYYSWGASFLHTAKFKTPRHKIIWEKHIKGFSAASIGRELNLSRWRISDIINEIKNSFTIEKKRAA